MERSPRLWLRCICGSRHSSASNAWFYRRDQSLYSRGGSGWIRTDSDLGIAHRNLEIGRQSMALKMMDEEHVVQGGCHGYGGS